MSVITEADNIRTIIESSLSWVVETENIGPIKVGLSDLCKRYNQDSIAIVEGITEFIK